ncbi:MAG: DUF1924 domain-containing protein [Sideroxydans sp.]|nr:DUF1924 domain-containing protein [Sideroxydans sp.]
MNLKICIALLSLVAAGTVYAETPAELLNGYAGEAARSAPDFAPSVERGKSFFARKWGVSSKMPNCQSCHGGNLTQEGKHVITGKRIAPLSPLANTKRFTSSAKVEKWFKRNCNDVVGRECTAAEKADLIKFFNNPGVKS